MVSTLHKEIERKVEKLKVKVTQKKINAIWTSSTFNCSVTVVIYSAFAIFAWIIMHLVNPKILHNLFSTSPGYYSRPKRNRRQWLRKILGNKQGALWSLRKWWIHFNTVYHYNLILKNEGVGRRGVNTYLSLKRGAHCKVHCVLCGVCSWPRLFKR